MDKVVADLEAKLATSREGGGAKAAERMRSRGKKLPRERCRFSFSPPLSSLIRANAPAARPSYVGWRYS